MPATPSGSLLMSPGLSEGQGDTICQRVDHYSPFALEKLRRKSFLAHLTEQQLCEITTDVMEVVLFAAIPEHFGGDEHYVRAQCKQFQANRPMPNGYRLPRSSLPDPVTDANALVKATGKLNPFEEEEPLL